MATVMVINYNGITGFPSGRHEEGNAIAYAGVWDWQAFAKIALADLMTSMPIYNEKVAKSQHDAAERAFSNLEEMVKHDLPTIQTAYVYVGVSAQEAAMKFILELLRLGKVVKMIACDCDQTMKAMFANKLGIEVVWTYCGGEDKCGEVFRENASLPVCK